MFKKSQCLHVQEIVGDYARVTRALQTLDLITLRPPGTERYEHYSPDPARIVIKGQCVPYKYLAHLNGKAITATPVPVVTMQANCRPSS